MIGGGHINCIASLSQPNIQKNSRAHMRGRGLKFEEKMLKKTTIKPTPEKQIGHRFPCILCFFIHPKPNNIGPARQQPMALFVIILSLDGGG